MLIDFRHTYRDKGAYELDSNKFKNNTFLVCFKNLAINFKQKVSKVPSRKLILPTKDSNLSFYEEFVNLSL